jgi:hypothetical protein
MFYNGEIDRLIDMASMRLLYIERNGRATNQGMNVPRRKHIDAIKIQIQVHI